ncbi:hypothetical protein [Streptomyces sp. NPDC050738]|uniref:hypothetical protein n=1 Tax=Streptomyces sp. NPDC050738 TaxID=3154744 RepID=UPI0034309283
MAAAAGISRRKALLHVAYMVECGWLKEDGRTPIEPLPGTPAATEAAQQQTALRWATNLSLSCRTCGRLMVVLATQAGGAWHVQVSEPDLSTALGIAERTTRDHIAALTTRRPHARHPQAGPLLRGERLPDSGGRGGLRWVFLDGKTRAGSLTDSYSPEEYRALRSTALDILAQAPLITSRMTARERTGAAELLIIPRLHVGYPAAAILAAMIDPNDHEGTVRTHAYGLIRWRLAQRAPESGYVAKAQDTYDPTPIVHDCADCGFPVRAPLHVTLCGDCQRRIAAGLSLDVVEGAEAKRLLARRVPLPS